MTMIDHAALTTALDRLPARYPGPGGVAGVVHQGQVVAARAWGHADVETALPMARTLRLPICSISKQFTCAALLASIGDPARLNHRLRAFLPAFTGPLPTARQLCDNRSGLRDYWAFSILQGAVAERRLTRGDALPLIAAMRTGHFAPGSAYSYCNSNFRLLAEMIEAETGETLEALCRRHVWGPARMATAVMASDTSERLDGVTGYEGTDVTGFLPAVNGAWWLGDAGIAASLDDMLAYEAWIDATRDDPRGLYRQLSTQAFHDDGTPAGYAMGLGFSTVAGLAATGHGGALRGFRAQRLHIQDARLSAVVMFNHEASAHVAAADLLDAALGHRAPPPAPVPDGWDGQWLCRETGLIARIDTGRTGACLRYAVGAEALQADGEALAAPGIHVERVGDGLRMTRALDHEVLALDPLPVVEVADGSEIAGSFTCDDLGGATMQVEARDGGVHARFTGVMGTGRFERLVPAGKDVWLLATRRSLDAPAPGDWTVIVRRDAAGDVTGLTVGCWLARALDYRRAG